MIGLLYLIVGVIYLVVLVMVTRSAYRWAVRKGLSRSKRFLATAGGFLIVYLPVFWDHIPTLVMHKYYCEKEAGFWVYKTLDQWKAENPGVIEGLVSNKGQVRNFLGDLNNFTRTGFMNQRFLYITRHQGPLLINRWRMETEIVDGNNNEILAREIDFSTSQERRQAGYSGWKFWLDKSHCSSYSNRDSGSIAAIATQIEEGDK